MIEGDVIEEAEQALAEAAAAIASLDETIRRLRARRTDGDPELGRGADLVGG